jgi:DNA topoisomerase I
MPSKKSTQPAKQTKTSHSSKILVIVESPSKCKKIEHYLGEGYRVLATYGHFRELHSLRDIVVSKDKKHIELKFQIDTKKERHISTLKQAITESSEVILATDDDREGEAIAWHICDYFQLLVETTKRMVFHEITESAIQYAIRTTRFINMNLVYAQFTRQVLDMYIGYKISPMLWTYISNNPKSPLSAGRCQTPALKMIADNQLTIQSHMNSIHHSVSGNFTNLNIPFKLNTNFTDETQVLEFMESSKHYSFSLSRNAPTISTRSPPIPFTTSRLQQTMSTEMHISPKETMNICQHLYEEGLITYMRTDNTKYSHSFIAMVCKYLKKTMNDSYISTEVSRLTETNHSAHEAIRPTNLDIEFLSQTRHDSKTCRVYRIIWENSVASCLKSSTASLQKFQISAPNGYMFIHETEQSIYDGWKMIYSGNKEKPKEQTKKQYHSYLQNITDGTALQCSKLYSSIECSTSKSSLHYTESNLIQLLEREGIGRPSTFASIVDKIQRRDYVERTNIEGFTSTANTYTIIPANGKINREEVTKEFGKEKNKLVIQNMGLVVNEFLYTHFAPLFEFSYTRETETILDRISDGAMYWVDVCVEQKAYISSLIKASKTADIKKYEVEIDSEHSYMFAKYSPVIKRTNSETNEVTWLKVKKDIDLLRLKSGGYMLEELLLETEDCGNTLEKEIDVDETSNYVSTKVDIPLTQEEIDKKELDTIESQIKSSVGYLYGTHEDEEIRVKTGKFGRYVVWKGENKSIKCFGTRDIRNIPMEEMEKVLGREKKVFKKWFKKKAT